MSNFHDVITFAVIASLLSLIGGALLLTNKKAAKQLELWAAPFAAGALLAAAFVDLIPEVFHSDLDHKLAGMTILLGVLAFFIFERFIRYFHHHHEHESESQSDISPALVITGDTVHNLLDGVAIAAAFSVDYTVGVTTTFAVLLHEIPQEIGDFGLLLRAGMSRGRVMVVNIFSALATVVGASLTWYLADKLNDDIIHGLVGLTAGFFVYIALSDIIPTIHHRRDKNVANVETMFVILGVLIVVAVTKLVGH